MKIPVAKSIPPPRTNSNFNEICTNIYEGVHFYVDDNHVRAYVLSQVLSQEEPCIFCYVIEDSQ